MLVWTALRFGPAGVSLALTVVGIAAIWSVDRGLGPFLASSPDDNVLVLQLFLLLTALPILCMAVVSSGRRRALRLFRSLLASLQDQVAVLDARGYVLEVNDAWQRFVSSAPVHEFGRAGIGEDFLVTCSEAAGRGNANAWRALAGVRRVLDRERRRFEMEYDEERGGRHEWYTLTVDALARADGGAVVIRADVTASRQSQMEAEEQRRELSHLARVAMLGELSGALAHELRQPLASILSNAEAAKLLLGRQPLDSEEVAAILQDIVGENRRAGKVIERLRALLRRGETRLQEVDSGELLREVLDLARMELLSRRVIAMASVDPDLPPVLVDRVQLQQVLLESRAQRLRRDERDTPGRPEALPRGTAGRTGRGAPLSAGPRHRHSGRHARADVRSVRHEQGPGAGAGAVDLPHHRLGAWRPPVGREQRGRRGDGALPARGRAAVGGLPGWRAGDRYPPARRPTVRG